MARRFNDPELQKQWERYQDYIMLHSGQMWKAPSFEEWRRANGRICPNEFWHKYFNSNSTERIEIIKRLVTQVLLPHLKEDSREERILAVASVIKNWMQI